MKKFTTWQISDLEIKKQVKSVKAVSYSINAANCSVRCNPYTLFAQYTQLKYRDLSTNDGIDVEYFCENYIYHYPYIFFCQSHAQISSGIRKYVKLSFIPLLKFSIPFHSGIFHIQYRNFRSISYHALAKCQP